MFCLRPSRRSICLLPLLLSICCLAVGCGGPSSHQYSGKVTFDGKPLPVGKILFMPDGSKGNSGPAGYADIKDGEYNTNVKGARGVIGGPMVVRIDGAADEKPLFSAYETKVDLPKSSGTKDFDVPAKAAKAKIPGSPVKPSGTPGTKKTP